MANNFFALSTKQTMSAMTLTFIFSYAIFEVLTFELFVSFQEVGCTDCLQSKQDYKNFITSIPTKLLHNPV